MEQRVASAPASNHGVTVRGSAARAESAGLPRQAFFQEGRGSSERSRSERKSPKIDCMWGGAKEQCDARCRHWEFEEKRIAGRLWQKSNWLNKFPFEPYTFPFRQECIQYGIVCVVCAQCVSGFPSMPYSTLL